MMSCPPGCRRSPECAHMIAERRAARKARRLEAAEAEGNGARAAAPCFCRPFFFCLRECLRLEFCLDQARSMGGVHACFIV